MVTTTSLTYDAPTWKRKNRLANKHKRIGRWIKAIHKGGRHAILATCQLVLDGPPKGCRLNFELCILDGNEVIGTKGTWSDLYVNQVGGLCIRLPNSTHQVTAFEAGEWLYFDNKQDDDGREEIYLKLEMPGHYVEAWLTVTSLSVRSVS